MIPPATTGDTWGISGPDFLAGYLALAVLVVVGSTLHRAWLFRGQHDTTAGQLGPQQIAYLVSGARTAIYSALAGLRSIGAVGANRDRGLRATGPLPFGATPLDQAVHHAAAQRRRTRDLPRDPRVVTALDQLRQGLVERGLVLDSNQRLAARFGPALLLLLLVVGVVRLIAGLRDDRPVGYLVLVLLGLTVVLVVQAVRVPHSTRAARAALRDLRRQYHYLTPANAPAYATYGPAGAAMGVALFGVATLWALDPGFAQSAELQRQAAGSGSSAGGGCGGGGDGGGCGGGGGGGCGGGGCGGCGG